MRINLGDKARDRVTGFEGICTCRTEYVSGCARVTLQPPVGSDGKIPEPAHFDEPMCEVAEPGAIKRIATDNGGPGDPVPQHAAPPR